MGAAAAAELEAEEQRVDSGCPSGRWKPARACATSRTCPKLWRVCFYERVFVCVVLGFVRNESAGAAISRMSQCRQGEGVWVPKRGTWWSPRLCAWGVEGLDHCRRGAGVVGGQASHHGQFMSEPEEGGWT